MRSPFDYGRGLYQQGVVFGPLAAALPFISAGLTVLGAISSSNAQRQAGDTAVANANARQQQMEAQAKQQEAEATQQRANANDAAAIGQRQAIEAKRKGMIMAGRAQTVMAAAGGGVDPSITAGLMAEGDYAGDVAKFEGDQRARGFKNQANVNDYNASGLRYGGQVGVWQAGNTKAAYDSAATSTLIGGIAKAGIGLASVYGGDWGGGEPSPTAGTFKAGAPYVQNDPRLASLPGYEDKLY